MKKIRFSIHASEQLHYRGVTEDEVIDAINTSEWKTADRDRMECRKSFNYDDDWNGRYYRIKQVRPVFVEEQQEIVVITVYAYFFTKEE